MSAGQLPASPRPRLFGTAGPLAAIDDLARGVVNGCLEPFGVGVHGVLHLCEESSDLVEESNDLFRLAVRHRAIFTRSGASLSARLKSLRWIARSCEPA